MILVLNPKIGSPRSSRFTNTVRLRNGQSDGQDRMDRGLTCTPVHVLDLCEILREVMLVKSM